MLFVYQADRTRPATFSITSTTDPHPCSMQAGAAPACAIDRWAQGPAHPTFVPIPVKGALGSHLSGGWCSNTRALVALLPVTRPFTSNRRFRGFSRATGNGRRAVLGRRAVRLRFLWQGRRTSRIGSGAPVLGDRPPDSGTARPFFRAGFRIGGVWALRIHVPAGRNGTATGLFQRRRR